VSGTILGLTFLHPDTIVKLPIEIHTQIRDTYYTVTRRNAEFHSTARMYLD